MHLYGRNYPYLLPIGTKYHGHPSINKSPRKTGGWTHHHLKYSLEMKILMVLPKKRDIHHCKSRRASVLDSPQKKHQIALCLRSDFSLRFAPPFACERSWDVRRLLTERNNSGKCRKWRMQSWAPQVLWLVGAPPPSPPSVPQPFAPTV